MAFVLQMAHKILGAGILVFFRKKSHPNGIGGEKARLVSSEEGVERDTEYERSQGKGNHEACSG
jgi:hypothetical protein